MESELSIGGETSCVAASEWSEDEAAFVIRPSWNVMVAQLAGEAPRPVRVSDFGHGNRVISRTLAGEQEERDVDIEDDTEVSPRGPTH
ncbi:MAG: hypothetical protein A2W04_06590 [Betaproteobacteria bacterium RBG_16_64_9]|nr:MAG: hypothetical protein A2W04_06590 [Betaproteobacteria bacterium RBG_16_64_9]